MKKIINTANAPQPIGPYNQAVEANGMIFVSGQIPVNPKTGKIVSEDVQEQTIQIMENIKAILEEEKLSMKNIVKASIFISDMNNFSKINEIYGKYFITEEPARECVQVAKLPLGVDVEISVIAVK